jgi:hypothetical protein
MIREVLSRFYRSAACAEADFTRGLVEVKN